MANSEAARTSPDTVTAISALQARLDVLGLRLQWHRKAHVYILSPSSACPHLTSVDEVYVSLSEVWEAVKGER